MLELDDAAQCHEKMSLRQNRIAALDAAARLPSQPLPSTPPRNFHIFLTYRRRRPYNPLSLVPFLRNTLLTHKHTHTHGGDNFCSNTSRVG